MGDYLWPHHPRRTRVWCPHARCCRLWRVQRRHQHGHQPDHHRCLCPRLCPHRQHRLGRHQRQALGCLHLQLGREDETFFSQEAFTSTLDENMGPNYDVLCTYASFESDAAGWTWDPETKVDRAKAEGNIAAATASPATALAASPIALLIAAILATLIAALA